MKKVIVVGAGFSGMSSAFYLKQAGFEVEVIEKEMRAGGLIETVKTPHGSCELAANGILNSKLFENLSAEIGLTLTPSLKASKKRYIYRGKPRRWPLGVFETLTLVFKFLTAGKRNPKIQENVLSWGHRVLGKKATDYLLAPALQGIYAGDAGVMSARLILSRFFSGVKKVKPQVKGLVAPAGGMQEFFTVMENYLKLKGVKFSFDLELDISEKSSEAIYVIATSARDCAKILKPVSEKMSTVLESVEMLSLIKTTCFYSREKKLKGFGILFPRNEGVRSLGVLFDNFIFPSSSSSETFILGGATDVKAIELSDSAILDVLSRDRTSFLRNGEKPHGFHIKRWKNVLPHYTLALEQKLDSIRDERAALAGHDIYLVGNYLGGIGLSQLLERAASLPQEINQRNLKNG